MSTRFESIHKTLLALAAVSTAAGVTACAGQKPAPQVPVSATETTAAQTAGTEGGCGAHAAGESGCGAHAEPVATSATSAAAVPAAQPTEPASASTAGAIPTASPATPAKPKKKVAGQASCGAGTCGKK